MPPKADAATRRIVTTYATQVRALRTRLSQYARTTWLGLGDWRDDDVTRWVDRMVPVVAAGQRQVATLTDAHLAQLARLTLGQGRPAGIPDLDVRDPAEVYRRPAVEMRTALAGGATFDDALERSVRRAVSLVETDLQLAKTHAARHVLSSDDRVVGYRRTLTGRASCGLCAVAATQRYRKGDLMPIHPGCDCGIQPIYATKDPGQVIDPAGLEGVHDAIAQRFGTSDAGARDPVDYRKALVVHEHGEIGPVLSVRGQDFTGPNDI